MTYISVQDVYVHTIVKIPFKINLNQNIDTRVNFKMHKALFKSVFALNCHIQRYKILEK